MPCRTCNQPIPKRRRFYCSDKCGERYRSKHRAPRWLETTSLPQDLDRRRALTEAQKEEIQRLYRDTNISIRELARRYPCSRRLIQFILFPDRYAKQKQRIKENWKKHYNREKHTVAVRNLRRYKKQLFDKGILKNNK